MNKGGGRLTILRSVPPAGGEVPLTTSNRLGERHHVRATQEGIDFTKDLILEQAPPATIFSSSPSRLPEPEEGPLSLTTTFQVDPERRREFFDLAGRARLIFLRNGACGWHLKEDLAQPNSLQMEVIVPSWTQHLRKLERMTKNEMEIIDKLHGLHLGPDSPEVRTSLHLDKDVLARAKG